MPCVESGSQSWRHTLSGAAFTSQHGQDVAPFGRRAAEGHASCCQQGRSNRCTLWHSHAGMHALGGTLDPRQYPTQPCNLVRLQKISRLCWTTAAPKHRRGTTYKAQLGCSRNHCPTLRHLVPLTQKFRFGVAFKKPCSSMPACHPYIEIQLKMGGSWRGACISLGPQRNAQLLRFPKNTRDPAYAQ